MRPARGGRWSSTSRRPRPATSRSWTRWRRPATPAPSSATSASCPPTPAGPGARRREHAGRVLPEHGLRDAQWDTFAAGAVRVARAVLDATGLRTVFHHHCAGWVETPAEIDALMRRTDPGLVGLCLDTGHLTYGGGDPLATLSRYPDRVWHVHFKDCDPAVARQARERGWDYFEAVRRGIFCELGRGSVDFPAVATALAARGYGGWVVVEQDVLPGMGTPAASARRNREYLRSIGL